MIVVVGGGIGGLTLARELVARDVECLVLEAHDSPGGVVRSATVEGRVLDFGPQRTRLTPSVRTLVDELDLDDQLLLAPPGLDLYVWRAGRLRAVPFSLAGLARSHIVSLRSKLRLLAEPLTGGPRPGERVGAYFRRKLGTEVYRGLVGPLYGGLYGSDPDDMEVETALAPLLREAGIERSLLLPLLRRGGRVSPPPACSFRQGMEALALALAGALGNRVRTGQVARRLERDGSGWRVHTASGSVACSGVVLTVEADRAASLLAGAGVAGADAVSGLRYNPLAVVHLHADTDLRGLGFQVALGEPRPLRGVTFNDSLFGREGVYTAYLGGATHSDVPRRGDDDLARLAEEEFLGCTGFEARTLAVSRTRMPAWDTSWRALERLDLPDGLVLHTNWTGRPGIPGRLAASVRLAERLAARQGARIPG